MSRNAHEETSWGLMPGTAFLDELEVDPVRGLSAEEAARRRATCGPNELPRGRPHPWWRTLARQFANTVVLLLVVAAAIAATWSCWSRAIASPPTGAWSRAGSGSTRPS